MPTTPTIASYVDASGSLGNGATYVGPARDVHQGAAAAAGVPPARYSSSMVVTLNPANPATVNVQGSQDINGPWVTLGSLAAPGGSQVSKEVPLTWRYARISVTNGAVTQTISTTVDFKE
jgi:hypothetical protein